VDQTVENAVSLIELLDDPLNQRRIMLLIEQEEGMRDVVRKL
jgi:hypothetical protein